MLTKKIMMDSVCGQLAIDYNCLPDDFFKDGIIFTEAKKLDGRRPFPWVKPRIEMVTMGNSVIINASSDVLPFVKKQLKGKNRYEVLNAPFVYGVNPYFLPNLEKIAPVQKNKNFEYELIEQPDIKNFYDMKGFSNALQYDLNSERPEVLVALAKKGNKIAGMASASADCKTMWQIGVDVMPEYRNNGIATILVNLLTLEVLNRGYIPYYSTDSSNVISQRVAAEAGYHPAWSHCFKTRLGGLTFLKRIPYQLMK